MAEWWRIVQKMTKEALKMRNSFEKIFLYIVVVMLMLSFPWLAFFPIVACLAHEENKQE